MKPHPKQMETFISGIKEIIQQNPYTRKDGYHVVFNGYGDFSLNVLLYVFLEAPDWSVELNEKQNLFLEIMKLAQKTGVEFAFPTQTLHVDSLPEKKTESTRQPYFLEPLFFCFCFFLVLFFVLIFLSLLRDLF